MRILVEAGLTPLKALQGATITGAKFMGIDKDRGSIGEDKIADILILSANPLDDINNTRAFHALIDGGKIYTADDMAALRKIAK